MANQESSEARQHDIKDNLDQAVFSYSVDDLQKAEETRILRETISQLRQELSRYKTPALMVAELVDFHRENVIIKVANGNKFLVSISNNVKNLKAGESVLVEQKNLTVVDRVLSDRKFNVEKFVICEKPTLSWKDVGGLSAQIREIQEVIELPLLKPATFKKVGIEPPKGILLHGPPGTGKTLLAKAVATSTNSTFIEIVGSELVQKFIGEGAKLVKEVFELARQKAPSVIFIDELDSIAARRVEVGTSGEREVQRTFMQLLAEIDGFDPLGDVKVIGCTNRKDILDPAILRPGRLDRLIEVPHPDIEGVKEIFKIHTKNMNIHKSLDIENLCDSLNGLSGAEIKSICTEAGYFAIRDNRHKVIPEDIWSAVEKVKNEEIADLNQMNMFG